MNRLEIFNGRHTGGRCVLVANGPSLNNMDLSFLKKEYTIGLNKIFLGIHKFKFYPTYLVCVNDKVLEQSADEISNLTCVKFLSNRVGVKLFKENALTYFINTKNPPNRFCKDISLGVHEGWTVTYAALQIAYFLGFKTVVIVGLDHRFKYSGPPNESKFLDGADPNHFCSTYFANSSWDNPDLERSEESYRIARTIFESDGRRIIDATVDGACDIFEKQDYRELFFE